MKAKPNQITIDDTRDDLLTPFGKKTLQKLYSLPDETPQETLARPAWAYADNPEHAQRLYDYASKQWFGFASPILANGGTERGLPISCYLNLVPDSSEGIAEHFTEQGALSRNGGAVGAYWGDLRGNKTDTSKGSASTGPIPFLKVADSQVLAWSQGKTRRGAYAAYMDISHPEIEEFIGLKKPTGGDADRKCLNSFQAVCIPDSFMQALKPDDKWALVDPHTKKVKKYVRARDLWAQILELRCGSGGGSPYIFWSDTVDRAFPQPLKDMGLKCRHSNLCVAPETLVLTNKGHQKISELVDKEVDVWNGEEFSKTVVRKTGVNQELITVSFSNGAKLECTPYHKFYIQEDETTREVRAGDLKPGMHVTDAWHDSVLVESVVDEGRSDDTYCFSEPKRGMGVFNGILTGNCSEITLAAAEDYTSVCCLSSVNIAKYNEWGSNEQFIPDLVRMLDNVLTDFEERAPDELWRAKRSVQMERSIGLGAMGWHTYLQQEMIPWESEDAIQLIHQIHKEILMEARDESQRLAKERGEPHGLKGTGRRNAHLIAIAPTAKNSIICGEVSEGIQPLMSNAFVRDTDMGSSLWKNPALLKFIPETETEVWDSIIVNQGSVQHLDILTPEQKEVFKTAYEIDQMSVVRHAVERQKWVDQAQSVNLFFKEGVDLNYVNKVHMTAYKGGLKTLYYVRLQVDARADSTVDEVEREVFPEAADISCSIDNPNDCLACEG